MHTKNTQNRYSARGSAAAQTQEQPEKIIAEPSRTGKIIMREERAKENT
jgi:hypothetical protein